MALCSLITYIVFKLTDSNEYDTVGYESRGMILFYQIHPARERVNLLWLRSSLVGIISSVKPLLAAPIRYPTSILSAYYNVF